MSDYLGSTTWQHCSHVQAGVDSLGAVELRTAIAARFAIQLPATVTFDHPTPAALAAYVAERMAAQLPAMSTAPVRPRRGKGLPRQLVTSGRAAAIVTHVISAAVCFPAAGSGLEGFWKPLHDGASLAQMVPLQRWDADALYTPEVSVLSLCSSTCRRCTVRTTTYCKPLHDGQRET